MLAVFVAHEWVADTATGFLCGVGVSALLAWLGHKHIVKPARRRHAEVMQAHHATHEHLGITPPAPGAKFIDGTTIPDTGRKERRG